MHIADPDSIGATPPNGAVTPLDGVCVVVLQRADVPLVGAQGGNGLDGGGGGGGAMGGGGGGAQTPIPISTDDEVLSYHPLPRYDSDEDEPRFSESSMYSPYSTTPNRALHAKTPNTGIYFKAASINNK